MSQQSNCILAVYEQNLAQIRGLLQGLDDGHLGTFAYEKGHDVRWVLGHIALSGDFAASLLGIEGSSPADWGKLFGPGTSGRTTGGPSMRELLDVIEKGHGRVATAYQKADAAKLSQAHGLDFFKEGPMKTVGDVLALLMTAHEGYHIAQLSACRCAVGLPNLF